MAKRRRDGEKDNPPPPGGESFHEKSSCRSVVKKSLPGTLSPELKSAFLTAARTIARNVALASEKGACLVNFDLINGVISLDALAKGRKIGLYLRQAFLAEHPDITGTKSRVSKPTTSSAAALNPAVYPFPTARFAGDGQVWSFVSQKYETALINSLVLDRVFESRAQTFILAEALLLSGGAGGNVLPLNKRAALFQGVWRGLKKGEVEAEMDDNGFSYGAIGSRLRWKFFPGLADGEPLSEFYRGTHLDEVVRFYVAALRTIEIADPTVTKLRRFTVAPIGAVSVHKFIAFDTVGLKMVLATMPGGKDALNMADGDPFAAAFRREALKDRSSKQGWKFAAYVETDGFTANIHYVKEAPLIASLPSAKKRKRTSSSRVLAQPLRPFPSSTDIVGVDPGRTNLVMCAWPSSSVGGGGVMKLTRRCFKTCSGVRRTQERAKRDSIKANQLFPFSALPSLKTADPATFATACFARASALALGLRSLPKAAAAREKLRTYGGSRRVLDGFFADLSRKIPPGAIVAYGAARMSPTGNGGELAGAAPVERTFKAAARFFKDRLQLQDEFRTTKLCNGCGSVLREVLRGERIRGLRACPSGNKCRSQIVDRDVNGALNIAAACRIRLAAGERERGGGDEMAMMPEIAAGLVKNLARDASLLNS